jgi:hypothetical protein
VEKQRFEDVVADVDIVEEEIDRAEGEGIVKAMGLLPGSMARYPLALDA